MKTPSPTNATRAMGVGRGRAPSHATPGRAATPAAAGHAPLNGNSLAGLALGGIDSAAEMQARGTSLAARREAGSATAWAICTRLEAGGRKRTATGSGSGQPLAPATRSRVEPWVGADLSGVRVHDGKQSGLAAHALGARAFAVGSDIHLGAGESGRDVGLMAHESSHVVQHSSSPLGGASGARSVHRDASNESVTPGYASALGDGDLMFELQTLEAVLPGTDPADPAHSALSLNLGVLRDEYVQRDPSVHTLPYSDPFGSASASAPEIPTGGTELQAMGVVDWNGEPALRLRSSPDSASDENVIGHLVFAERVQVLRSFDNGWYFLSTAGGAMGYAASAHVRIDLPEPNARMHLVEPGIPGTAIAIAERYYGEYADNWGQDLRFYINVLAWANDIAVPDSTFGWRDVHFRAGQKIWVPSQPFAYGLKGAINSGSISYNIADALGLATIIERIAQIIEDFGRAIELSGEFIGESIERHVEQALWGMLEGLVVTMIAAVALLAVTTAIGAGLGALAGGVGAAPGAAAGFEVGLALIEWLGMGMLAYWIVDSMVALGTAFGSFIVTVWNADGDEQQLQQAAHEFAEAVGLLLAKLLEGVVMLLTMWGMPRLMNSVRGTRFGRALGDTRAMQWLAERAGRVESGESPLPSPGTVLARVRGTGRPGAEPAAITRAGNHEAFHNLPPDRLPANLPEGHFWMRNAEGTEWVLMREAGANPAPFELTVYSDGTAVNYNLRSNGRLIQSDAITRTGGTHSGTDRLPTTLDDTGAANPYRDPMTGEVWDKGHGVDHADTLEGPGVLSSTTDIGNFTPQASWWNQGPRNSIVGRIRDGHVPSGRPGGGGYREMAIYAENPPVTANGTPIPREFIFVETNAAGAPVRAWRIPNQQGAGGRSAAAIDAFELTSVTDAPSVILRTNVPMTPAGPSVAYAPGLILGVRGDNEAAPEPDAGAMCEMPDEALFTPAEAEASCQP